MPYADPQKAREYRRQYYSNRRRTDPKFKAAGNRWNREWRKARPEWVKAANKRAHEKGRTKLLARAGYLLSRAKQRAKQKRMPCELTREWILQRLDRCLLSGLEFDLTSMRCPRSPSIDRIDSSGGYTPDNCRVILLALNVSFSDWGQDSVVEVWRAFLANS